MIHILQNWDTLAITLSRKNVAKVRKVGNNLTKIQPALRNIFSMVGKVRKVCIKSSLHSDKNGFMVNRVTKIALEKKIVFLPWLYLIYVFGMMILLVISMIIITSIAQNT